MAVKDPTAKNSSAIAKAAQIAIGLDARLTLFHDIATPLYAESVYARQTDLKTMQRTTQATRREQLEKIAQRVRLHGIDVDVAAEWDFPVFEAVIRMARKIAADLVVTENHVGGSHRARWLLTYTDWELLRHCPAPTLLVKSGKLYHRPRIVASVDPLHAYAKPANLDRRILHAAGQLASALEGELHVLHAFMPPLPVIPGFAAGPMLDMSTERDETRKEAHTRVDRAVKAFDVKRQNLHVVEGRPFEVIPGTAKSIQCAIVAMGAISRSGLKRFFIGNTAERVIDALSCDILVVKPQQFESRVPRTGRGVQILATPMLPG